MQEMIELSKLQQEQPENPPRVVSFVLMVEGHPTTTTIQAGPAQFGLDLKGDIQVYAPYIVLTNCSDFFNISLENCEWY